MKFPANGIAGVLRMMQLPEGAIEAITQNPFNQPEIAPLVLVPEESEEEIAACLLHKEEPPDEAA